LDDAVGGPWETDRLALCVLNDDDLMVRVELFEPDDRDAVLATLDASADTVESAGAISSVRALVNRFVDAYNTRDWPALEAVIATNVVQDDQRPLGWGYSTGFDSVFQRIQIGIDATPDAQLTVDPWLRESGDVALWGMPMRGHVSGGGGDFQLDRLMLTVIDGNQIVRIESFGLDQEQLASDRFEALAKPEG